MTDYEKGVLEALGKIFGLLELLAEEKIAQRDAKQRAILRQIVGGNKAKQRAIFLMNGQRAQKDIVTNGRIDQSDLSKLVGRLEAEKLLTGDKKFPLLAFPVPANFFETDGK
jgi:hypothetical protein